jgi:putative RNA 2'-phosphotransferase
MMTKQPVETKLIHTIAHALRHDPTKHGLEPDPEGWVSFDDLIIAIRFERREWMNYESEDIAKALAAMNSDRFEIQGARIRAAYGHSIALQAPPAPSDPPEFLFHGTNEDRIAEIMAKGLLSMARQFVHLSSDFDWVARFVATKPDGVILRIRACQAQRHGICFRPANSHVWLADPILEFLQIERCC